MKRLSFILPLLLVFQLNGQNLSLYVADSLDRVPVQFVLVESENPAFRQTTDENGFIRISHPVRSVRLSCVGYEPKTVDLSLLDFMGKPPVIFLTGKVVDLSEVTVRAGSGHGIFKTISDLDIHLRPINNSQEVLRMVPGLFIGQHAGGGKAEQIFLRGFDLDHGTDINISVDGMAVNMVSHAHGQGYADLHFVIPELIDRVNFNKGPYFADKGNFTTAGYVEFRTKNYLESDFIKVEAGQFDTYRGVAGFNLLRPGEERRNQSLYLAGEGSFTEGYFDSPQDFRRFNGLLKYHGELSPRTSLTAALTGFTSEWNASGQIPDRAVENGSIGFYGSIDDTEGGETSRYNANVELLTNLGNGGSLRNQVYYSRYLFELYSNFTFYKEDPVNGDQIRQKESRDLWGYHGSYQKPGRWGKWDTETRAGVQLRYDVVDNLELTRTRDREINTDELMLGDVQELNAGAYLSQKVSFSSRLELTAAVRVDHFDNRYRDQLAAEKSSANSTIVSPKLNLNYTLNDRVQLYFYNGRGFHSNDTRVAVQENGKKVLPPAWGSDLGGIFKPGKKLFIQSAVWYLWLDQEFVYVGDEGVVEAGGKTRRYGFDLSGRYEIIPNLFADADLSLAHPRAIGVPSSEHYLPLAPTLTSIGGLTWQKQTGWNGSLRYRYMGERPANETNTVKAEGYFVIDGAVNYATKKWEAGIAVQNLLDTKWKETQFDTESRLQNEPEPVSEIHFTPGTPFFARLSFAWFL